MWLRLLTAAAALALSTFGSLAQAPLRIIVPAAAGGGTDVLGRIIADALSQSSGRRVFVENRVGNGIVVGTDAGAKADPDGNTVLLTTISHALNPALFGKLPYDSEKDFVPIAHVANVPLVLVVNPAIPATDLKSFLALLKAEPGKYAFGTAGKGTAVHIAVELLKYQAGVDALHVPYRGAGPAMIDLLAGNVQFMIDLISTAAPYAKEGKLRALGVTSPVRSPTLPDVPTIKEAGLPDYEAQTWNVVLAPKGTPAAAVAELNKAINLALQKPETMKLLDSLGVERVSDSTPDSTAAFLQRETEKWSGIIRAAKLSAP